VGFNPSDGYEGGDGLGRFESRSGRFGGNLFNVVGAGWMLLSTMVGELQRLCNRWLYIRESEVIDVEDTSILSGLTSSSPKILW
jgi:hypothetical protein